MISDGIELPIFDTKEEAEAYADGSWKTKEFNKTYRKGLQEGGPPLSSDQKMYLTFYNMARDCKTYGEFVDFVTEVYMAKTPDGAKWVEADFAEMQEMMDEL